MKSRFNYYSIISLIFALTISGCATEDLGDKTNSKAPIQLKYNVNELISESRSSINPPMKTHVMKSDRGKDIYLRYTSVTGMRPKSIDPSRGIAVTYDNFFDDYGLLGYIYSSGTSWSSYSSTIPTPAPLIENESVAKVKNWMTNEYWEGSSYRYSFFGYAPHNAPGVSGTPSSTNNIKPGFHYTVPALALEEADLLVGKKIDVAGNYNNIVYMPFTHALTAVRFALGSQMAPCTITHLRIVGAYGEADYDYATDSWQNISTKSNFTLEQHYEIKAGESNRILNNEDNIFMMLPQTVPSDCTVEITVNDGETHVFKTGIGGDVWQRGHMITYYISTANTTGGNVISISASSDEVSGLGGTREYTVNSYYQTYYGTQTPVPWTAVYSINSELATHNVAEGVVTDFTASGPGDPSGETFDLTLQATTPVSTSSSSVHTAALRAATVQGSAGSHVDLSSGKGTANCYVVSAPGYYSFPLVYGNAINASGATNSAAYNNTSVFVNHAGTPITGPSISGANDAVIVWQDAPNLVSPSSLQISGSNLKFQIKADSICQGNAVIAVRDASQNILWSWHIWVTDEDLTAVKHLENSQATGSYCEMMPVPLGYCDYEKRPYETRTIKITATQTGAGAQTASAYIYQGGIDEEYYEYGGNAPYYQWGRKDPFLPSNGKTNTNKPAYNNEYDLTLGSADYSDIKSSILNPHRLSSTINTSSELWNVGSTTGLSNAALVKSIYDPCPVGFSVPRSSFAVGLSDSGRSYWGTQKKQVGKFIFSDGPSSGYGVFFPALGWRGNTTNPSNVNQNGWYWAANAYDTTKGYGFNFNTSSIGYNDDPKVDALSIIPETY